MHVRPHPGDLSLFWTLRLHSDLHNRRIAECEVRPNLPMIQTLPKPLEVRRTPSQSTVSSLAEFIPSSPSAPLSSSAHQRAQVESALPARDSLRPRSPIQPIKSRTVDAQQTPIAVASKLPPKLPAVPLSKFTTAAARPSPAKLDRSLSRSSTRSLTPIGNEQQQSIPKPVHAKHASPKTVLPLLLSAQTSNISQANSHLDGGSGVTCRHSHLSMVS